MVETSVIRQNVAYSKEYITTSSARSNNVILAKAGSRMRKNSSKICPRVVDCAAVFVASEECQAQKKSTEEVEEALGEIHTGKECSTKQLSRELNR